MLTALLFAATALTETAGQSSAAPPVQATTALVVRYADGRSNFKLASARRLSFWTPAFPTVRGWKPDDGQLPITALQLAWQLVDGDVRVDVSVLRGTPHQTEDAVASVTVKRGAHVLVGALRAFGVEPIDLYLTRAMPLVPFVPSVVSVTPDLEISAVDILSAPYAGYRITVRNLTAKRIANFRFMSYRGKDRAYSGVPRGQGGRPAMGPGESFSFTISLLSGRMDDEPVTTRPLDVIEIQTVLFDDGTVIGDATQGTGSRVIAGNAGRRAQLTRAIEVLRKASSRGSAFDTIERIRSGFEALPTRDDALLRDAQEALRSTRAMAIDDLKRLESAAGGDPELLQNGVRTMLERYEAWVRRLSL